MARYHASRHTEEENKVMFLRLYGQQQTSWGDAAKSMYMAFAVVDGWIEADPDFAKAVRVVDRLIADDIKGILRKRARDPKDRSGLAAGIFIIKEAYPEFKESYRGTKLKTKTIVDRAREKV